MNGSKSRWWLLLWKFHSFSFQFWKHLLFKLCGFRTHFLRFNQINLNGLLKIWFANTLTIQEKKIIFLVFQLCQTTKVVHYWRNFAFPLNFEASIYCFLEICTSLGFSVAMWHLFLSSKRTEVFIAKSLMFAKILNVSCLHYKFYCEMLFVQRLAQNSFILLY